MPLYEFICEDCGETFEELVSSTQSINQVTCPFCKSDLVRKLISTFSAKISGIGTNLGSSHPVSACKTQST